MGVVRRDGSWRLEKREDGFYEITYKNEPEAQILTSDFSPGLVPSTDPMLTMHEVDSYQEAEGLFEEYSQGDSSSHEMEEGPLGPPSTNTAPAAGQEGGSDADVEPVQLDELPAWMIGTMFLLVGGALFYSVQFSLGDTVTRIGLLFTAAGLVIFGVAGHRARTEGLDAAIAFLTATPDTGNRSKTEKTPEPPQRLKTKIKLERAGRQCEYCGERSDHLKIHHIIPRNEGGPNDPDNLISLCSPCHDKAHGIYNRDELRYKIEGKTISD